ncbi:MAG TPA: ABC-F family ATP-binding cassette domain-containing protein [Acidimicrobiales bacterium]|nr:ABC-F family ATP-binding cassette domain-containing protein [Acidimicrobiales bacterium]
MSVLVDLQDVGVTLGDRVLFADLAVTVATGDRLGVVGINGTGKSTLLRVLAGRLEPDTGTVRRGRGVRTSWLGQTPELPAGTVRDAAGDGWEAAAALDRLGMAPFADADVATLSGGQAKRVALARVLADPGELLVLDEPTNHLDLAAVAWLEEWLAASSCALVLVTHDRYLLDRVTTRMLELDRGTAYVHEGGYASYLEGSAEREEQAASAESTRRNLARTELAWLRRGAKARSRKPRARVEAARQLVAGRPAEAARAGDLELDVAMTRLGTKVIECADVGFAYEAGSPILRHVDLLIGPGDRLGVVGANGTGKSTLLDLLAGRRTPTAGTVEVGPTVVVGYYDQHGAELDPSARVAEVVAGPHRTPGSLSDVALMKRFWFTGNLPHTRVGDLSGGERRRLQLLAVLAGRPNVLLLDEPTNDLDLDTLRILEDFLDDWSGTLVVVSHDRAFLDRTIESVVAVGPDGVSPVSGGLDAWLAGLLAPPARTAPGADPTATTPTSDPVRPAGNPPIGRLLRDTEKQLTRLGRQRDALHEALVATTDHVELTRLGIELRAVQEELDATEDQWLELAEQSGG